MSRSFCMGSELVLFHHEVLVGHFIEQTALDIVSMQILVRPVATGLAGTVFIECLDIGVLVRLTQGLAFVFTIDGFHTSLAATALLDSLFDVDCSGHICKCKKR